MASSEATDSRTNSLTNRSSSSNHNDEEQVNEIKGWLMKRKRLSRKWEKQWFLLKNTDLFYGNTPEVVYISIIISIIIIFFFLPYPL